MHCGGARCTIVVMQKSREGPWERGMGIAPAPNTAKQVHNKLDNNHNDSGLLRCPIW